MYELIPTSTGQWAIVANGNVVGVYANQAVAQDLIRQYYSGTSAPGAAVHGGQIIGGTYYPVGGPTDAAVASNFQGVTDADLTTSPTGGLQGADYGITIGGDFQSPFSSTLFTPEGSAGLNFSTQGDILGTGASFNIDDFRLGGDLYNPQLGYDFGEGSLNLTGNTPTGTFNVGGEVETPLGSIGGSTNVPDEFDADTSTGDILEFFGELVTSPIDTIGGIFDALTPEDLSSLGLSGFDLSSFSAEQLGQLWENLPNLLGQGGDSIQNFVSELFSGSPSTGGGTPAPTGGTPAPGTGGVNLGGGGGGVDPLLGLLGGAAALLGGGGENTITQNTSQTQAPSPLLSGQDPLSLQVQGALGQQLTAPDVANNPYFQPALDASFAPVIQRFLTQILPALQGQAVLTGNLGGSRQGVAQGMATNDLTQNLSNAAAQAALQANLQGQQLQGQAINTAGNLAGQTRTGTQSTVAELDPFTTFLSGLTGTLGLIGEYNQYAGGGRG